MEKLQRKSDAAILISLCSLVYFTAYVMRINFGAALSEIVLSEGFQKSDIGIVSTMSFASYGIGQMLSGLLGDRFNPRKLIFCGMAGTTVCNLLIPHCAKIAPMAAIWLINGLAQSAIWAPMVKLLSVCLEQKTFAKGCTVVCVASSFGTAAVYFLAPLCIKLSGWRLVFWVSGMAGGICALTWLIGSKKAQPCLDAAPKSPVAEGKRGRQTDPAFRRALLSLAVGGTVGAIFLHGVLKDGVTTWVPSYLIETFSLDSKTAILCSVLLPVLGVAGTLLAPVLYGRKWKNELSFSAGYFGAALCCAAVLLANIQTSVWLSLILAGMINCCMHAINMMLICTSPARFVPYGRVSTAAGLFNFFTYVGSALSIYLFAKMTEQWGWNATIASWVVLSAAGAALCLLCRKPWDRQWHLDQMAR